MSVPTPTANLVSPKPHRRRSDMSAVAQDMKAKAEVYHGDETCRKKVMSLLIEMGLPSGLITLEEMEEYGYVKETGFVWLKHKSKRREYKVDNVAIYYEPEVTAYFGHSKIKNLTGVRAKEFLFWVTLSEVHVKGNNPAALITFKTISGLSKSFPLSMFTFEAAVMSKEEVKEVDEANIGNSG